MAIDRTNVSGVLTSTFLPDTGMTRDQANTGVSLLWLGIVLLEIPSNVSCVPIPGRALPSVDVSSKGYAAPGRCALLDPSEGCGLGPRRGTPSRNYIQPTDRCWARRLAYCNFLGKKGRILHNPPTPLQKEYLSVVKSKVLLFHDFLLTRLVRFCYGRLGFQYQYFLSTKEI